ncbi:GMC oxidoreductase [Roseinatronobacter ekhonensis]
MAGTYRMGSDPTNSVVDAESRCWDHRNLYLLGSGTFPTITTANPTLTIAALTFRASRAVLKDLAHLG